MAAWAPEQDQTGTPSPLKKKTCSVSGCHELHETSPCGMYGGQAGTRTGFSLSTLVFP